MWLSSFNQNIFKGIYLLDLSDMKKSVLWITIVVAVLIVGALLYLFVFQQSNDSDFGIDWSFLGAVSYDAVDTTQPDANPFDEANPFGYGNPFEEK